MISAKLGKTLEDYIQHLMDAGRYSSISEVLREGVRLIQERETRISVLDASIMRGVADGDAGRTHAANAVFDELRYRYKSMTRDDRNAAKHRFGD